jgi:ubiquinol-cytochrome c reductase cytochrome c subunit
MSNPETPDRTPRRALPQREITAIHTSIHTASSGRPGPGPASDDAGSTEDTGGTGGRGWRGLLRARIAVPTALAGTVLLVGLLAFSPNAAQASSTTTTQAITGISVPTTTLPTLNDTTPTTTPIGTPSSEQSVSSAIKYETTSASGLFYIQLPKAFIAPGQALFAANCSSCHGSQALGSVRAPNLQGLGAGTVDFWVSTGRMPLANSSVQATRKPPRFNRIQTLEIAAWVQSLTPGEGVQIPVVNTNKADLEAGNTLFTLNCAACHTITGAGDALADGAYAPSLHLATTTQIVEAIRSGPGNMPHFSAGNITNTEARDIASYVHGVIQHPSNPGGVGLGGIGPVGEGFVGLLIGVGVLMLVCFWIGERT